MNAIAAWRAYTSLSPGQKGFLGNKRMDATLPREEWIAFLAGVAKFDAQADSIRKLLGWVGGSSIPIAVIASIVLESALPMWLFIIPVIAFTAFFRMKRLDLPNSLSAFLLPVLSLLREETTAATEVALKLDLRGYSQSEKFLSRSGTSDDQMTNYQDRWVASSIPLADGSLLNWEIVDLVRERRRERRNSRGRTKTKTKIKVRRTIDIHLKARSKNYTLVPPAQGVISDGVKCDIKPGEKRFEIRIRSQFNPLTPDESPMLVSFVDTVASAYRQLSNPAALPDKP